MNTVNMTGRLVEDPEEINYKGGKFAAFTLAVDRPFNDETDFFQCTSHGKTGENIVKYLKKGRKVGITGRVEIDMYKKDGQNHYPPKIRVERFTFLDSNNSSQNNKSYNNKKKNSKQRSKQNNQEKEQQSFEDNFDNSIDEDLDEDFDVPF